MAGVAGKDNDRAAPLEFVPFEVRPEKLSAIETDTAELGFTMASDTETGALLRTLAASKPSGDFLELGTGTGLATAWLLAGMDAASTLASVDTDPAVVDVARRHLEADARVTFHVVDGGTFLQSLNGQRFDLIFADAWPGKFSHRDTALAALKPGGL